MQRETDTFKLCRVAVARHFQHWRAHIMHPLRKDLVHRAAHHHLHQGTFRHIRNRPFAHELPVAEHRVAVCNPENLIKLVADEQNGLALALQRFNQRIQFLNFLVRQRRRGLIHDDHPRINRQCPRNGHQMF